MFRVGYSGGSLKDPVYCHLGDHTETVEVEYDPEQTSYKDMLKLFWENHNSGSLCSRQYMSAIFYHSPEQKALATSSLKAEEEKRGSSRPVTTKILPAETFYNAEDYYQKYLLQRHSHILEEIDMEPGEELITSFVACRLNGYLGGYGTLEGFESECKQLQLPPHVENFVRTRISKRKSTTKG